MKNIKTRGIFITLLSLLCAVILGCCAAIIIPRTSKTAKALVPSTNTTIDLTITDYEKRTDGKAIDPLGLSKLFDAITGVQYSKLSDVTALGDLDASQLKNNGLVVNFGGFEWNAVYFTHNTNGEPILTLWLADVSSVQSNFSYYINTSNQAVTYSYPADMYSTSEVRINALNAGGDAGGLTFAVGQYDCSGTVTTDRKQNIFAAFTLSSSLINNKSLTKYIEVPNNIAYQQDENFLDLATTEWASCLFPNDALGIPKQTTMNGNGRWYTRSGITQNYSGIATGTASDDAVNTYVDSSRYTEWGNDYLWLPSITETGFNDSATIHSPGIWNVSTDQRQSSAASWMRSGWAGDSRYAVQLEANGSFLDNNGGTRTHDYQYVRPALHLNLAAMGDGVVTEPTDVTQEPDGHGGKKAIEYDGNAKNLDAVLPEWYLNVQDFYTEFTDITYRYKNTGDTTAFDTTNPGTVTAANDVVNAGRYEITITLKSSSPYTWYSGSTPVTEKKVILTIKQKEVKFDYRLYDTSSGGSTLLTGTSVKYTSNASKTYAVKPYSTTAIPSGTTNLFPDWEIKYKGTINGGTSYNESTTVPTKAGSYQATLTDKNAGTSNYILKGSTPVYNYTVDRAEVNLPTFSGDKIYNANAQDFNLTDYDTAMLKIASISAGTTALTANAAGTKYSDADNYFVVDYDATGKKLSATNAATYTVTFGISDENNYTWATAIQSSAKTKTFTIEKKELVISYKSPLATFNLKTSTKGDIKAQYTDGAATPDGGSVEKPMLNLFYVFSNGAVTGGKTQVGSTAKIEDLKLDVTTLKDNNNSFGVGKYTLTFELAPDTAAAVNKNYKLGASATQEVNVTAGEASIDDINIVYNTVMGESNGDANAAIPTGGLTYAYDKTHGATEYKIYLDFLGISYLDYENGVSSLTYDYADGSHAINKAGKVTVTAVIKSTSSNHNLPAAFDVTQTNKFKSYVNNNNGTATITFEVEIKKAVADVKGSDIPLMYQPEGGAVTKYDPTKPPEYNGKPVTITLGSNALFPDSVKKVEFDDAVIKQTTAGDYKIRATVTLTDNYVTATGTNTLIVEIPWKISKEQIELTWTNIVYADDYLNDTTLAHLQIPLLTLTEAQKENVEYEFYKEVGGVIDTVPMTEAELKAICTNDRFTETTPTYIYVKAVLTENGAKKYELENDATKNPKRFKLGGIMTLINLTVSDAINGYEYGGELDTSTLFTLKNSTTGDVWDKSYYDIKVRKDGADLCSLADFDPKTADAGEYTFVIDIKPEYADSYTLDTSNKIAFKISPKAIALPEIGVMQFNGSEQNIASILGGSYAEYKDIIQLSNDLQKRNVGTYTTVLTITNPNYKWAQPSVQPAKLSLTDGEITLTDDVTAQCSWSIAPMVVNTSKLWNKSKDGATLNLPDNIKAFVDAGTLEVGYKYYDAAGQFVESPELKGGKSFKVEAVFAGTDAELGNIVFEKSNGTLGAVSEGIDYTVPQSGAAAFFGKAVSFLKANWLWFLIGALALIFLIVLICIIAHRRKTKEERLAKKEAKEEEKRRKEEEREEEKRRREQERELEKAKAEAELAKMRAGLGLGAGAAGLAMAAQQQPMQPMQQQMPQQMPMQQPMMQQFPQYPQYPQYMPQQMPMPQQYPSMNANDVNALAEAKAQQAIAEARAAAAQSKAAEAIAEAKAAQAVAGLSPWMQNGANGANGGYGQAPQTNNQQMTPIIISVGADGQIRGVQQLSPAAMQQPMVQPIFISAPAPQPKPQLEYAQKSEETSGVTVNTPTVYPPDAVITTTTTVDTTKSKPVEPVSRDSDRNFDIDGFYDAFEENKRDV